LNNGQHRAFSEEIIIDKVDVQGQMLHFTAWIGKANVNILDVIVFNHFLNGSCV